MSEYSFVDVEYKDYKKYFNSALKRPIAIEVVQITPELIEENKGKIWRGKRGTFVKFTDATLHVFSLEGYLKWKMYDWIIRGAYGEFYVIDNEIFTNTYYIINKKDYYSDTLEEYYSKN